MGVFDIHKLEAEVAEIAALLSGFDKNGHYTGTLGLITQIEIDKKNLGAVQTKLNLILDHLNLEAVTVPSQPEKVVLQKNKKK